MCVLLYHTLSLTCTVTVPLPAPVTQKPAAAHLHSSTLSGFQLQFVRVKSSGIKYIKWASTPITAACPTFMQAFSVTRTRTELSLILMLMELHSKSSSKGPEEQQPSWHFWFLYRTCPGLRLSRTPIKNFLIVVSGFQSQQQKHLLSGKQCAYCTTAKPDAHRSV